MISKTTVRRKIVFQEDKTEEEILYWRDYLNLKQLLRFKFQARRRKKKKQRKKIL